MKKILNNVIVLILITSSLLLLSCGKDTNEEDSEYIPLVLNTGAVLFDNGTEKGIKNLIDGSYQNIDEKRDIVQYNKNGTVLFVKDGKGVVEFKGKEIILNDDRIIKESISPAGDYLTYFIENENNALVFKLLNLKTQVYEDLNIPGVISGDLVDWYDDETIVFYGVSEERRSGVFTYNLKTKVLSEVYESSGSYITYLESSNKEIIIKEETLDAEEYVKLIDKNGKASTLASNIRKIIDVEVTSKGIFLLGNQINDDRVSIFEHKGDEFQNIIFDFPSYVNFEKGISSTLEGELLFIGSNTKNDEEVIYGYLDGSISSIELKNSKYRFIKMK